MNTLNTLLYAGALVWFFYELVVGQSWRTLIKLAGVAVVCGLSVFLLKANASAEVFEAVVGQGVITFADTIVVLALASGSRLIRLQDEIIRMQDDLTHELTTENLNLLNRLGAK